MEKGINGEKNVSGGSPSKDESPMRLESQIRNESRIRNESHSEQKNDESDSSSVQFSMKSLVAKSDPRENSVINTVSLFIDEHKQYIQYGFYTLGLAGVITIGRSLRAFTRFTTASDIPHQFYKDHVCLRVKVKNSDIGLLRSEYVPKLTAAHIPRIQTPFNRNLDSNLSILVPGVHINKEFSDKTKELLKDQLTDKKLQVRLLEKYEDSVVGEAYFTTWLGSRRYVGQLPVNKGYARVSGNSQVMSDKCLRSLNKCEASAKRSRLGVWKQLPSPSGRLTSIFSRLSSFFKRS